MVCRLHRDVTKIVLCIMYAVQRATLPNADFQLLTRARQATYQRVEVGHKMPAWITSGIAENGAILMIYHIPKYNV